MNAAIERRPTLVKKPVSDDVVAGLTGLEEPAEVGALPAPRPEPVAASQVVPSAPAPTRTRRASAPVTAAAPRRGPGRPRGRRRMEPFSSKIEIGLRDELDAYLAANDESIVDFLDRVIRAGISAPPPGE